MKIEKSRLLEIFNILRSCIPNAEIELEYEDAYSLVVSVVLSARSTDVQVNRATKDLFKVANTPQAILKLGYEGLCSYINTVGLYKTKAKNIISLSQILIDKYGGKIPDTREKLMELPGIGLKSANVILNVLFKKATVAVDTHVFRVSKRLEISEAKTPEQMSHELEKMFIEYLPKDLLLIAHHLLVLHGRYTCKAIKPKCEICPLRHLCNYKTKVSR